MYAGSQVIDPLYEDPVGTDRRSLEELIDHESGCVKNNEEYRGLGVDQILAIERLDFEKRLTNAFLMMEERVDGCSDFTRGTSLGSKKCSSTTDSKVLRFWEGQKFWDWRWKCVCEYCVKRKNKCSEMPLVQAYLHMNKLRRKREATSEKTQETEKENAKRGEKPTAKILKKKEELKSTVIRGISRILGPGISYFKNEDKERLTVYCTRTGVTAKESKRMFRNVGLRGVPDECVPDKIEAAQELLSLMQEWKRTGRVGPKLECWDDGASDTGSGTQKKVRRQEGQVHISDGPEVEHSVEEDSSDDEG